MKNSAGTIPQLPLVHHDQPVPFLAKTIEEVEEEHNEQLEKPHRHDYYSVIWVEKGSGTHHIDFKSYRLRNNSVYFISPEQVHHLEMKSKGKGYALLFTNDFMETNGIGRSFLTGLELFFACDEVSPIQLRANHTSELKNYIKEIFREFRGNSYLREESIATWLKLFLIACKRIKAENNSQRSPLQNNSSRIVRGFKEFLEKQYKQFHKVNEYAAHLQLTSNYLNEVIKTETGLSAKDIIQDRIMLEAKRLATYSELSLKEIAYELGFDDPAHFSKYFKNITGKDFTGFRDQIRKKYN
jgi:AraC-like DNA-binding protein